ncbi:hypothetical protein AB0J28_20260 [Streptosporangium canum]|uniref:hypothetical protein n=1 Tax=Streptosporangium canum TaxID=324952 RepID=UPI0034374BF3
MKLRIAVAAAAALLAPTAPTASATAEAASALCFVRADGWLYCENDAPEKLWGGYTKPSPVNLRDYLYTNQSTFKCWAHGTLHNGGNDIWYYAQGDKYGNWGWLAAQNVHTLVDPPARMNKC